MVNVNGLGFWARTVGMPIGDNDTDAPINPPIKQKDVKRALALRKFLDITSYYYMFLLF